MNKSSKLEEFDTWKQCCHLNVREAQETFFTCRALKTQGDQVFHQRTRLSRSWQSFFNFDRILTKDAQGFSLGPVSISFPK